ncbi:ubiquitin conjugating enzyme [Aureococcus anophagefferens]|uniref:Ubiquitin conjugating enzyme n=1 Tax=Aureococcus anophagefferens TaxID=44056 RepID=A0ABR1G0C1_AURAN
MVEAFALVYTPRALSSISNRPNLLKLLLFFDVVATFVPALLVTLNLEAFEVASHEIEYCNELTMAFANLVLLASSSTTAACRTRRVAHYFEFTFAVLSSFVTFWFCLDNRAMGEEEVLCIMYGDHRDCSNCTVVVHTSRASELVALKQAGSLNAARARGGTRTAPRASANGLRRKKGAAYRLRKELAALHKEKPEFIWATHKESNILLWSFLLAPPSDSVYGGGWYWGRLTFPAGYPFAPPSIIMCTPSGRFQVDHKICMSMSDYHPESWNPSWSVSTILKGVLSFMLGDEVTTGAGALALEPGERGLAAKLAALGVGAAPGAAAGKKKKPRKKKK